MPGWSRLAAASASRWKRRDVGLAGELPGEDHLERDRPVEAGLPGLEDDAHAPAGDLPRAARNRRSSGRCRGRGRAIPWVLSVMPSHRTSPIRRRTFEDRTAESGRRGRRSRMAGRPPSGRPDRCLRVRRGASRPRSQDRCGRRPWQRLLGRRERVVTLSEKQPLRNLTCGRDFFPRFGPPGPEEVATAIGPEDRPPSTIADAASGPHRPIEPLRLA